MSKSKMHTFPVGKEVLSGVLADRLKAAFDKTFWATSDGCTFTVYPESSDRIADSYAAGKAWTLHCRADRTLTDAQVAEIQGFANGFLAGRKDALGAAAE